MKINDSEAHFLFRGTIFGTAAANELILHDISAYRMPSPELFPFTDKAHNIYPFIIAVCVVLVVPLIRGRITI